MSLYCDQVVGEVTELVFYLVSSSRRNLTISMSLCLRLAPIGGVKSLIVEILEQSGSLYIIIRVCACTPVVEKYICALAD